MAKLQFDDDDYDEAAEERALAKENAAKRLGKTRQAMEMRIQGFDYAEIAYQLGYGTADAAAKDVHDALEEEYLHNERTSQEVLRMIELKRLNTLYNSLQTGIERGNTRAIDIAVKVSERIAKLTGVEAAVKTQVEVVEMQTVNAEIERLKAEIAARTGRVAIEPAVVDAEIIG